MASSTTSPHVKIKNVLSGVRKYQNYFGFFTLLLVMAPISVASRLCTLFLWASLLLCLRLVSLLVPGSRAGRFHICNDQGENLHQWKVKEKMCRNIYFVQKIFFFLFISQMYFEFKKFCFQGNAALANKDLRVTVFKRKGELYQLLMVSLLCPEFLPAEH